MCAVMAGKTAESFCCN